MHRITLTDRVRYQFDNLMSKGPIALIGWLFLLSAALILAISTLVVVAGLAPVADGGRPLEFWEVAWMGLMRTLDAGTMGADTGSWPFLFSMFAVTLGGVFVVSMLIGILTSSLEQKIGELRKGRSFVVETDHTVILGWSPQIFSLITELCIANENRRGACIAVLAEKDKVEMEDEIRDKAGATGRTRVVCRSGSPIDLTDLDIVNPHAARSIVILSPEGPDPDSHVVKTILAITNHPRRRPEPYHIVAEIRDPKNMEAARLVGRDEASILQAAETISRIMVQTCRQSGLSVVYTELLDFGGDEIYFQEVPPLVGRTYGEALSAFETSAVIGLAGPAGIRLNPPPDTRIVPGERVIAISADDDTIVPSAAPLPPFDPQVLREPSARAPQPERTLILGWNRNAPSIVNDLDAYVAPGSRVTVAADAEEIDSLLAERCTGLENLQAESRRIDTTNRRALDSLDIAAYHHVITLAYSDELDTQSADARTLITLLHLRDIAQKAGHGFSIVSEMQDIRNRELADVTRADDFIVSDKLISLMLSQISENKDLMPVFADLFDPEGAELYLKEAEDYVAPGAPVPFYAVVEAARRRGETAIGYRLAALSDNPEQAHGVRVNPMKSARVTFSPGDKIIVLAEC